MNRQSIFFTLTISFVISIILVVISFGILMIGNQKKLDHHLVDKYRPLTKMLMRKEFRQGGLDEVFAQDLKRFNYDVFLDQNKINAITYNPKTKVIAQRQFNDVLFRVLQLNDRQFLYLKRNNKTFFVEDKNEITQTSKTYIILGFVIILLTLILSFIVTLRKLMPLKLLKEKVNTLGDENFDFECCNMDGKDEVSQLAREFKNSAKKLKDIKEARNVFIRNIMHELKTPITKGKFLAELEKSPENNLKLKEVFNRLESLINEFASIEELISSNKNIEKKPYFLNDIMDNVKDILMIEDEEIISSYDNKKFEVNFKLFSIAVKNLIDNALKYSDDNKVEVKTEENDILFINSGKELEYELEQYYEPFFANEEKRKNSFGLGLYIIHNILKANGYTLFYEYKDGKNIFTCKKDDELSTI
ncbi:ArsS family sensor histidine kinase [Arcobacter arenosus]|uniref:ArsS family sensor histidine kinase n=1 Tax=Arcobacter arenosus TaxID=2576037 RepID=UPI003BAA408C